MNVFRSLTAKLLVIYVPLVCISVLVLFSVLEVRYLRDQKADLAEKLDKLLTVESAAFATPAWEFDLGSIELLMKAIALDEDIQDVSIYDARGSLIAETGDEKARPIADVMRGERDLSYQSGSVTEIVGKLTITFHQDRIHDELKNRIQADALIVFALAAILLTVIWGTTRRVIGNPLGRLQAAIETAKEGGGREHVAWESTDELGQVVRAYNEMQERQTAAEAEIARYRNHLEALVAERTSELEASQSELSRKTDILQAVLDSISQRLAAFDADLKLIAWNSRYLEVRGYPDDYAVMGRSFEDFIRFDVEHNEFGDGDHDKIFEDQVSRARLFESHEFERERPNGRAIEIRGGPIPGGGFVSTYADITDRKLAEAELAEKEAQLRLAMDNMTGGIFLVDSRLNLQVFNDNFAKMYDLPANMVHKGASLKQIIQYRAERGDYGPENVGQLVRDRLLSYEERQRFQFEDHVTGKRTVEVFRAPSEDGGTVAIFNDITDRKKAEEDLKYAHGLITESIGYASRIQRSVLPAESALQACFADYFVLWQPKDVVGGDMFWHRKCENGELVIVADCTGHGVPGAFMTMIATGALDQALVEIPNCHPSAVLQRMNQLIQGVLGQDTDEGESDDGLELGICHVDTQTGELMFAGARFFLWQVADGELTEIRGDKKGIGYRHIATTESFRTNLIEYVAGMSFYMIIDGMIDQIGGVKRRAFGKKRIRQLILDNCNRPMAQQKENIYRGFVDYQGDEEQRDDLTLVGFKAG